MAESSLFHTQDTPPSTGKGHGTDALGPSDSSDSGSDVRGGPGLNHDDGLEPRGGNTPDGDVDKGAATAGPDIGDANLDSDSDRYVSERSLPFHSTLDNRLFARVHSNKRLNASLCGRVRCRLHWQELWAWKAR